MPSRNSTERPNLRLTYVIENARVDGQPVSSIRATWALPKRWPLGDAGSQIARPDSAGRTGGLSAQSLFQIGHDVLQGFDSHGQPYQILPNSHAFAKVGRDVAVRADERVE